MAICPVTGVAIPECSCAHCLEDQVRRFRPVLLEPKPAAPRAPVDVEPRTPRGDWPAAA
jgi:hypothetical protein